jgi:tyrosyl-tRNA synthetase
MKETKDNPVMQLARLIVFPRITELSIKRPVKFGGNVSYKEYLELESDYTEGKLHPTDLKNVIIEELEKIIAPVRKNFK